MNQIFEIEGVEPGTKLLVCETTDRLAIRVVVEVNGVKVGVMLDYQGKQDLFSLPYKLDIQRAPSNDVDGDS